MDNIERKGERNTLKILPSQASLARLDLLELRNLLLLLKVVNSRCYFNVYDSSLFNNTKTNKNSNTMCGANLRVKIVTINDKYSKANMT